MAMDIRITSGYRIEMGALFRRQLLAVFQIVIVLNHSFASPVWMPQFLSAGQGRNIRHLPCVSRRTGEQGVCMFAYTCMKSNGTHLGTCIDRFYFGSCCRLGENNNNNDLLLENNLNFPVINNNQVSSPFYPDDAKIDGVQTTSILNNFNNQFTPVKTSTVKIDTSASSVFNSDKTVINLAQNLATSTEKIYVPVFTSTKPNKTSDNIIPVGTTGAPPTTTQQYFLSTFQVVHSEGDTTTLAPATTQKLTTTTTTRPTLITKPSTPQLLTSSQIRKNETTTTKPTTTTKKPSKPVKPYTTTRKPPTKKPTSKPIIKTTTSKPPVKVTTSKPTKKPVQTTKKPTTTTTKPTTPKPTTAKPSSTAKTPITKPDITSSIRTTTKSPTTINQETTSEVVFTRPGLTPTFSTPTTLFGITTFRPDLTPTTGRPILITGPGLTTFSYVSEGTRETTLRPETTTSRIQTTTKPTKVTTTTTTTTSTTISNEISSSEIIGAISEVQEENTNIIFQQAGSTDFPSSPSSALNGTIATTSSKPNASVPFFPETSSSAEQPTNTPWIEIVQSSTSPASETVTSTSLSSNASTSSTTHVPMFTGLNASDYTQVCGRRLYPESRVVGGEKSTFGKWPWQISLRQWRTSTYLHKCGAALLNENWAITAAHCVENVPPSDLLLRLGEHDLSTEDEPYGFQERRVQIVASHPQFDPRTFEYDLALLRFYEPVKFQPNIIPVCVPEDNTNFVGQTAYVTGWGRLYEDGPLPSVLQEVSVPVINNTLCENMYRAAGYIEHIPHIFICAGWKKGGFDSCEGDSGGPMVIQRPDKRWLLAGVISWGIGCAEPNQPGVYTRISEFREWIHQILQF